MTQGMPPPEARRIEQEIASDVTKVQEIGGLVGRFVLAYARGRASSAAASCCACSRSPG